MTSNPTLIALIDTIEHLDQVKIYDGSTATFEAYHREFERLLQWTCLIADKSILGLFREDIESHIQFCMKPPSYWIGKKQVARFIVIVTLR